MIGLWRRLCVGGIRDSAEALRCYERLLGNEAFVAATSKATARPDQVADRLRLATAAFTGLE